MKRIRISHEVADGACLKKDSFLVNDGLIRCITFNPDSTKLFCGCENGEVLLLDLHGNKMNGK